MVPQYLTLEEKVRSMQMNQGFCVLLTQYTEPLIHLHASHFVRHL